MESAHAATFRWEMIRRNRWGWLVLALWLAGLLAFFLVVSARAQPMTTTWGAAFALSVMGPATVAVYWFVAIFSYSGDGNVSARESMFPRRLFTLPVTTTFLVTWPMAAGALVVALLWTLTRLLAPWPADIDMPAAWPGLLAIALLAWTQVLTWSSYPARGMRVAIAVVGLSAVGVTATLALELGASEGFMIALLAPHFPVAWLAARRAVTAARRGDVAGWRSRSASVDSDAQPLPDFETASAAQRWLEWKRFGWSLPVMVGMVLPVEMLLFWVATDAPAMVGALLVIVALTPPFMATFTALAVRDAAPDGGLGTFTLVRPLSSASLIAARLAVAARSTLTAWAIVLIVLPPTLWASGTWPIVSEGARDLGTVIGAQRVVVLGALVLAVLVLTTWRQMVQSLYLGMAGRPALVQGTALAAMALLVAAGLAWDAAWGFLRPLFWPALNLTLAVLVIARAVLASRIAVRLHRERLVGDGTMLRAALLWLLAVTAVYGVLLWFFSTALIPRALLLALAIVMVPLVRLSVAPLAVARGRHR
ncbi:MAG: hypothetical protein WD801_12790 [Gemmatimonadaceae bacterium]